MLNPIQITEDEYMDSIIPFRKEVSFIHFNPDWGYLAYIEKSMDGQGEPTYKVIRVPLEGGYGKEKIKK